MKLLNHAGYVDLSYLCVLILVKMLPEKCMSLVKCLHVQSALKLCIKSRFNKYFNNFWRPILFITTDLQEKFRLSVSPW